SYLPVPAWPGRRRSARRWRQRLEQVVALPAVRVGPAGRIQIPLPAVAVAAADLLLRQGDVPVVELLTHVAVIRVDPERLAILGDRRGQVGAQDQVTPEVGRGELGLAQLGGAGRAAQRLLQDGHEV